MSFIVTTLKDGFAAVFESTSKQYLLETNENQKYMDCMEFQDWEDAVREVRLRNDYIEAERSGSFQMTCRGPHVRFTYSGNADLVVVGIAQCLIEGLREDQFSTYIVSVLNDAIESALDYKAMELEDGLRRIEEIGAVLNGYLEDEDDA